MFWFIYLVLGIIAIILDIALGFADEGAFVFTGLLYLIHLIPSIAVSARRLHDIDKSGWWLIISPIPLGTIILIVFFCLESTGGPNRFGPAVSDSDTVAQNPMQADVPLVAVPQQTPDMLEQLNKLKAMHDNGTIDDAEFAKMKADIIAK